MAMTSAEMAELNTKVQNGTFTLTDALNGVATANTGKNIRKYIYAAIVWLKYNWDQGTALLTGKQPTLIAGENITISNNVISATDTKTTCGAANASLSTTNYPVLVTKAGTSRTSYINNRVYVDGSGKLYVDGHKTRMSKAAISNETRVTAAFPYSSPATVTTTTAAAPGEIYDVMASFTYDTMNATTTMSSGLYSVTLCAVDANGNETVLGVNTTYLLTNNYCRYAGICVPATYTVPSSGSCYFRAKLTRGSSSAPVSDHIINLRIYAN